MHTNILLLYTDEKLSNVFKLKILKHNIIIQIQLMVLRNYIGTNGHYTLQSSDVQKRVEHFSHTLYNLYKTIQYMSYDVLVYKSRTFLNFHKLNKYHSNFV